MIIDSLRKLVKKENQRQADVLSLIPSENYASREVLALLGSALTNKYSEGYPGKRYYPGNENYDKIELLAQKNALALFKLNPKIWSVNVQAYSGSPANLAIYLALAKPGEKIMGLELSSGGHLTHGHSASMTGKIFKSIPYEVAQESGLIDYSELQKLAQKHHPRIIISGTTSYPRIIDFKKIGAIAKKVGAYHVADISHIAGLVSAGIHKRPFEYADVISATTHKTLAGPRGALIFSRKELEQKINRAIFPGLQGGPHNNVISAIAQALSDANTPEFKKYINQVIKNNQALARTLIREGFSLVTGGTDNHLLVIDLRPLKISGSEAEKLLEKNHILGNRNVLPRDSSALNPSGLRLGTPSVTRRGFTESATIELGHLIAEAIIKRKNIKPEIQKLCRKFPAKKFLKA